MLEKKGVPVIILEEKFFSYEIHSFAHALPLLAP